MTSRRESDRSFDLSGGLPSCRRLGTERSSFARRLVQSAVPSLGSGRLPEACRRFCVKAPHRVYFYSHEPGEPPHVHVDRDDSSAKFWLNPIALAVNFRFTERELRTIETIVRENQQELIEAWNEHFRT